LSAEEGRRADFVDAALMHNAKLPVEFEIQVSSVMQL
jgi:hypothetical protein